MPTELTAVLHFMTDEKGAKSLINVVVKKNLHQLAMLSPNDLRLSFCCHTMTASAC